MSDSKPPDPLARLGERLKQARAAEQRGEADGGSGSSPGSMLGFGLRIGAELVAALFVGVILGLVADYAFGTRPWFLIVFFFVGAAAGVLNVYRATQGMGRGPRAPQQPRDGER